MNKAQKKRYFVGNAEDGLDLYMMTMFIDVWPKVSNKYLKNKIEAISIQSDCHIQWCPDKKKYLAGGREVLENILKNPAYAAWLKRETVRSADKLKAFANRVKDLDVAKLSDSQLRELLKNNYELALPMVGFGMLPTAMEVSNDLLTNHLMNLLTNVSRRLPSGDSQKGVFSGRIADYFQSLTDEPFRGEGDKELQACLKMALQIKTAPKRRRSAALSAAAQKLSEKYSWQNYNYQGPFTKVSYYRKQLQEHLAGGDIKKKLRELATRPAHILKLRRRAEKTLALSARERKLFAAARDCVYLKIYRREVLVYAMAVLDRVFKEMAKRTGYSVTQIRHCQPQEMNMLFRPKRIARLLDERKRFSVYYWQGGKPQVVVGKKARKFVNAKLEKDVVTATDEIRGTTGFPGFARGCVKIINKPEDIKKMKDGDILVSILTIPQIVPAMKMSAAIVTDIGGITSHAAIVSRELKKPCVIGTRIATKVLKDGDMVEVDANNGVVTKI